MAVEKNRESLMSMRRDNLRLSFETAALSGWDPETWDFLVIAVLRRTRTARVIRGHLTLMSGRSIKSKDLGVDWVDGSCLC